MSVLRCVVQSGFVEVDLSELPGGHHAVGSSMAFVARIDALVEEEI